MQSYPDWSVSIAHNSIPFLFKGPWSPKLPYTFCPFSWKCGILW